MTSLLSRNLNAVENFWNTQDYADEPIRSTLKNYVNPGLEVLHAMSGQYDEKMVHAGILLIPALLFTISAFNHRHNSLIPLFISMMLTISLAEQYVANSLKKSGSDKLIELINEFSLLLIKGKTVNPSKAQKWMREFQISRGVLRI